MVWKNVLLYWIDCPVEIKKIPLESLQVITQSQRGSLIKTLMYLISSEILATHLYRWVMTHGLTFFNFQIFTIPIVRLAPKFSEMSSGLVIINWYKYLYRILYTEVVITTDFDVFKAACILPWVKIVNKSNLFITDVYRKKKVLMLNCIWLTKVLILMPKIHLPT